MTTILTYIPPKGSPLAEADTVRFAKVTVDTDARGRHRRVPLRTRIAGWLYQLSWTLRNAVPVITTRGRYQQAIDEANTDGCLWGLRNAADVANARVIR